MPDITDYGPTIADLERKRDDIDRTIAMLRALSGMPAPEVSSRNGGPSGPVEFTNKHFFGMKAPEAVLLYLELVKEPRGASRMARDLVEHGLTTTSDSPANTIRTTLRRLAAAGQVVQIKTEWALPSWYPGLRRSSGTPTNEGRKPKRKAHGKRPVRQKALKDGSMVGSVKGNRSGQSDSTPRQPMTYHEFMGEHMRSGKPKTELGTAWRAYKAAHGLGE